MCFAVKVTVLSIICFVTNGALLTSGTLVNAAFHFGEEFLNSWLNRKAMAALEKKIEEVQKSETDMNLKEAFPMIWVTWGETFENILQKMNDESFTEERTLMKKMSGKLKTVKVLEENGKLNHVFQMIAEWKEMIALVRQETQNEVMLQDLGTIIQQLQQEDNFKEGGKWSSLMNFNKQAYQKIKDEEKQFLGKNYENFVLKTEETEKLKFSSQIIVSMRMLIVEGSYILFQKKKLEGGLKILKTVICMADDCTRENKKNGDILKEIQKLRERELLQGEVGKQLIGVADASFDKVNQKVQDLKKYADELEEELAKKVEAICDSKCHVKLRAVYVTWIKLVIEILEATIFTTKKIEARY